MWQGVAVTKKKKRMPPKSSGVPSNFKDIPKDLLLKMHDLMVKSRVLERALDQDLQIWPSLFLDPADQAKKA